MRHFAMTGISTTAMISRIFFGEAMRATPPSARICAGTRSRAITATAPARCAISACFASVTSMITPPLSISARPVFRRRLVLCPLFCDMGLLFSGNSFQLSAVSNQHNPLRVLGVALPWHSFYSPRTVRGTPNDGGGMGGRARTPVAPSYRFSALHKPCEHALWIDRDEQAFTARQHFPFCVQDLGHIDVLPALHLNLPRFHAQRLVQRHRLQIVHGNLGRQGHHLT